MSAKFRIDLTEASISLARQGDYVVGDLMASNIGLDRHHRPLAVGFINVGKNPRSAAKSRRVERTTGR